MLAVVQPGAWDVISVTLLFWFKESRKKKVAAEYSAVREIMASRLAWGERGREHRHPDRTDCLVNKISPVHFISTFFSRKVVFQRGFHDTSSRLAQAFEKNHIKTDFPNFSLIRNYVLLTGIFFFLLVTQKRSEYHLCCSDTMRFFKMLKQC